MRRFTLVMTGLLLSLSALTGCNGFNLFRPGGLADVWTVSYVEVKPGSPRITVGATQQFRMVAYFLDYHDEDKTGVTQWSSSNPAVATINNVGLATAIAPGTTKIKGIYKDHSDDTTLTVVAAQTAVQALSASAKALSFTLSATGREYGYVLDSAANRLVTFARDGENFDETGDIALRAGANPGTMALHSSGKWLYVGNRGSAEVAVFGIDPSTGSLTEIASSPFAVAVTPMQLSVTSRRLLVRDKRSESSVICAIDSITGAVGGCGIASHDR